MRRFKIMKGIRLTYFDVFGIEMPLTSEDFATLDLSLKVPIHHSIFRELIEPIVSPFSILVVPCGR
jgi:hypothetical protein